MKFKAWVKGIDHREKHLESQLNEYNYRFNRLKEEEVIFDELIGKMVNAEPVTIPELMSAA